MPKDDLTLLLDTACFAAAAHRRKGAGAEPYVNHVLEVAAILTAHAASEDAIIAGLLHDTVEDSGTDPAPTTLADLAINFGPLVAAPVAEVSDDKALPKETLKALQVRHAATKSAAAKQLKLADKTSNLRAIVAAPPTAWNHARQLEYVGWAGRVAAGIQGVNPTLEALFAKTYRDAVHHLAAMA